MVDVKLAAIDKSIQYVKGGHSCWSLIFTSATPSQQGDIVALCCLVVVLFRHNKITDTATHSGKDTNTGINPKELLCILGKSRIGHCAGTYQGYFISILIR